MDAGLYQRCTGNAYNTRFLSLGILESFERDAARIKESWVRVNQCALGSGVLACSAWPLSRERLAELLGFDAPIINGLDSSQVSLLTFH